MHMAMHRHPAIALRVFATGIKLMGCRHQAGNQLRANQFWGAGHRGGGEEWFVGAACHLSVCGGGWVVGWCFGWVLGGAGGA